MSIIEGVMNTAGRGHHRLHRPCDDQAAPAVTAPPPQEHPVLFACQGERLLGIVHPSGGATGVVVVVGGPQYRAGSHRQFVQLARALAAAGHPVLRFDARGMGDSSGTLQPFDALTPDIGAAIDALMAAQPQLRRVVLWGLCDGASAALIYLADRRDPRVAGLCLLNPWARSAASQARTQVKHYYRQRLMQPEFWRKLLSGRVARGAVSGLLDSLRAARGQRQNDHATAATAGDAPARERPFQDRMAQGWRHFDGPIQLVLSGQDYTAREFLEYVADAPAWRGLLARPAVQRLDLADADHTFSTPGAKPALAAAVAAWLARLA